MIVVLVHLGDILLHQVTVDQVLRVFVRVCEAKLLVERSEFLLGFDRVEDWGTGGHGLFQIRFGEFAQILIVCKSCLNGQCKCVSLCQESHLVGCFVSLEVLRVEQLDFGCEVRRLDEVDDCLHRDFGLVLLLFNEALNFVDLNNQEAGGASALGDRDVLGCDEGDLFR